MKILIDGRVLTHDKITGVENYTKSIIENMTSSINITVVKPKFKNKYYAHFWQHLILPIKALKYNLLFCPSNIAPIYLPKTVKLVLTLHDLSFIDFPSMYSSIFQKYYRFVIPFNLKRADYIVTISNFSKNRIVEEYPFVKTKISCIYHGVSEKFKSINNKKENYILYVGSLNEIKNFSSVIKSFKMLESNTKLIMILPKSKNFSISRENKLLLEDAAFNNQIKIYDYMEQDKLIKYYQDALVFIFPSFHESFGFPVLEAMKCGTPVISSNIKGLKEVAGEAALYCNPYDIDDIKNKMELLLKDNTLQECMVNKGKIQSSKFSWKDSALEHIKLFEKVISEA